MLTWVYDEIGCAGAIVDEYCVRNLSGEAVAWVFGVSLFSLKGEHIGWCEDGVFYDIDNRVLGFIAGAKGLEPDMPALVPEPSVPKFSKRPYVPTLRGRSARPAGRGWSSYCLATYLEFGAGPQVTSFVRRPGTPVQRHSHDLSH
ncbi:MAG: hypothetical protein V4723_05835 [Pseudomonadota bacterium]